MKKTSTCKGRTETSVKHQISDFNPALFKCHHRVAPESFYCNRTHRDLEHAELVSSQPCGEVCSDAFKLHSVEVLQTSHHSSASSWSNPQRSADHSCRGSLRQLVIQITTHFKRGFPPRLKPTATQENLAEDAL